MTNVTYAVGDIHGMLDCLTSLRTRIASDADYYGYEGRKLVYLGDYIDRGPNSKQVIDELMNNPLPGFEEVFIKGNHELFVEECYKGEIDANAVTSWLIHGGIETLQSYGADTSIVPDRDKLWTIMGDKFYKMIEDVVQLVRETIPSEHVDWIGNLDLTHDAGSYFFVHAGIDPYKGINYQDENDFCWIREPFLNSTMDYGKVIVHGHTPTNQVDFRSNRIGVDTGSYMSGLVSAIAITDDSDTPRVLKSEMSSYRFQPN